MPSLPADQHDGAFLDVFPKPGDSSSTAQGEIQHEKRFPASARPEYHPRTWRLNGVLDQEIGRGKVDLVDINQHGVAAWHNSDGRKLLDRWRSVALVFSLEPYNALKINVLKGGIFRHQRIIQVDHNKYPRLCMNSMGSLALFS